MAKNAAIKMIVGSTWKAMNNPMGVTFDPSLPNTNSEPAKENSSSHRAASPAVEKTFRPAGVLSTNSANTTCRESPQTTVLMRMARRLEEKKKAAPSTQAMPIRPVNRPMHPSLPGATHESIAKGEEKSKAKCGKPARTRHAGQSRAAQVYDLADPPEPRPAQSGSRRQAARALHRAAFRNCSAACTAARRT